MCRPPLVSRHSIATPRADDLGQAVDVDALMLSFFSTSSRMFSLQGSAPKIPTLSFNKTHINTHRNALLGQIQRVRRRATNRRRTEILQNPQLPFGVAAGHRYHAGADSLRAVMNAQTAREKPVTIRVVNNVSVGQIRGNETASHQLGPVLDITLGVRDHRRTAGGSRRSVQTDDTAHRLSEHAEGIIVP